MNKVIEELIKEAVFYKHKLKELLVLVDVSLSYRKEKVSWKVLDENIQKVKKDIKKFEDK